MKKLQFLLACPAKSLGVDKIKKYNTPANIVPDQAIPGADKKCHFL
jgi:hypothetical protein